ncbi:hypothetical protein [Myxacorys almedinensis]|uniref:Uncharacterized protein n=1 Tax=Myxacorys almedinensis A TaxID=2690445 RepID=A0A8J8CKZ3_9CYAN|nr:hypothetical protein [Myxacorys almedinensis]NDJ17165.1 hypothetical protein [Myxacorys almedinensis A]
MLYSLTSSYVRSLLLTLIVSFLAPVLLVGGALALLLGLGVCPLWSGTSQTLSTLVLSFLATFGNGNAWEGIVVIGGTCALVGALFDTYTFYRHYTLRKP